jgi:major type 1 subunit fimbrin (pilin)
MKRSLIALALAMATSAAHALPDNGSIMFTGRVNGNTCSIEITDPYNGAVMSPVVLPEGDTSAFKNVGDESPPITFGMKVTSSGSCDLNAKQGFVTFSGKDGAAGAANELHALHAGSAVGVALAIKDNTGVLIPYGDASKDYDLDLSKTMIFQANLRSIASTVAAGPVNATIPFVFNVK